MWTVGKLRDVIEARGETMPDNQLVGEALLAHERLHGRTEEDYSRGKAAKELDQLLDRIDDEFPPRKAAEYAGLKELRAYAQDRAKKRDAESGKTMKGLEAAQAKVIAQYNTPDLEEEYDR